MSAEIINEETAVQVAEQINDAAEAAVEYVEIIRSNPALLAGVGVLGVAAGAVGGYFIAKKILTKQFEERSDAEIAEARAFYSRRVNKIGDNGEALTPQDVLVQEHGEEALEALTAYQGGDGPMDPEDEELLAKTEAKVDSSKIRVVESDVDGTIMATETQHTVTERNVFVDPTFDLQHEKDLRVEGKPYVISHDEFYDSDKEYENQVLTYFEADDTVVDEGDKALDDPDHLIGEDSLLRFGHGSRDKNIVYVRNDRLEMDFEIVRGSGSYLEALGLGPEPGELKHSDQRDRRRAFRQGEG